MNVIAIIVSIIITAILSFSLFDLIPNYINEAHSARLRETVRDIRVLIIAYQEQVEDYSNFDVEVFSGLPIKEEAMLVSQWENLKEDGTYKYYSYNDNIRFLIQPTENNTVLELRVLFNKESFSQGEIDRFQSSLITLFQQI